MHIPINNIKPTDKKKRNLAFAVLFTGVLVFPANGYFHEAVRLIKGIKQKMLIWFLLTSMLFIWAPLYAFEPINQEGICPSDSETSAECIDGSVDSNNTFLFPGSGEKKPPDAQSKPKTETSLPNDKKPITKEAKKVPSETEKFVVHFFWGKGCPHCEKEKRFLNEMKKKYSDMRIEDHEVWYDKDNAILLSRFSDAYKIKATGVPVTFIDINVFVGFSDRSQKEIEESMRKCLSSKCIDPNLIVSGKFPLDKIKGTATKAERAEDLECTEKSKTVVIPWIGSLDASEISLPVITFVIAGLDSFNPCAFFVLFSLLGLLLHAQSRKKMFLIGSVFVFFSGFIYFLFMAAWLNIFLVMGQVAIITKGAGIVAILIAAINIKDFFLFKKGVSLTIPDSAKPKLFDRMRKLIKSTSLLSILIGTAVLAVAANSYELLCTAGFPMVFTRILTLNKLSAPSYYIYLIFYNLIYIIPLSIIVVIVTVTLGKKNLTEWQGRLLKLLSGTMMLGLGGILLFNPAILSNVFMSLLLLLGAIAVTVAVFFLTKIIKYSK